MNSTEPILLNEWAGETPEVVFAEFAGTRWGAPKDSSEPPISDSPEFKGVEILLASYGTGGYEGIDFVLFRRDGQLYEVNGSHCSCYGLEHQWDPELTTVEALRHRLTNGNLGADSYYDNSFATELHQVLDALEATP